MFLINAIAKPKKESEYFKEVAGAYVSVYINFKDINGALKLAKHYIKDEGWKTTEIEEYFFLNSIMDVEETNEQELYKEAIEHGYALAFNCYEEDDEEE